MKKKIIYLALLLFTFTAVRSSAQSVGALTIFSEDGDKFYLILNGLKQNNIAQTNVRVDGLTQPNYTVKIIFENTALPEVSRNYLMIADANGVMNDVTYKIKHDKNGNPKIAGLPVSFTPYQQNTAPSPDSYVVHYGQPDAASAAPPVSSTTTVTQTTTTAVVPDQVNMNVNGVNMAVTITDPNATAVQTTTTSTTYTTTTTTAGVNNVQQTPPPAQLGCVGAYPMSAGDFNSAITSLNNQSFDDTRLSTAKQIAGSNCLSTKQIVDICKTFSFENNKLDFAKFAYTHCTDPKTYFRVNDVFDFDASKNNLNSFVQSH